MQGGYLCDQCGKPVKVEEVSVAAVQVSAAIEPANVPQLMMTEEGLGMGRVPKMERFELCVECALALLVALKNRKLQIQKHGQVVPV